MIELEIVRSFSFPLSIAGVDEVGRGPLAGPVVGGCFSFSPADEHELISVLEKIKSHQVNDSKKLTASKRRKILIDLGLQAENLETDRVFILPKLHETASICLKQVDPQEIDKMNIFRASQVAMALAWKSRFKRKDFATKEILLVDGPFALMPLRGESNIQQVPLIKGDSRSLCIALASIAAKEYRDALMNYYSKKYPRYGLEKHSGYPTVLHKEAIRLYGPTPIHRRSFRGVREYVDH